MPAVTTSTVLYLPLETDYTDLSGRHVMTSYGSISIDNTQSATGSGSAHIAETGPGRGFSGHLQTPAHTDFGLGTVDFVIDSYVRLSSLTTENNNYMSIIGIGTKYGSFGRNNWDFNLFPDFSGSDWQFRFEYNHLAAGAFKPFSPVANTWYRATLIRSGTALTCYVNGVQLGSVYNIGTTDLGTSPPDPLYVGAETDGGDYWRGWIDYVYLGRDTSTFPSGQPINFYSIPGGQPVNFYSVPATASTTSALLYLPMDTNFNDYSSVGATVTSFGDATISGSQYVFGGGSGKFTSVGGLTMSPRTDLRLTNLPILLDFRVNFTGFPALGDSMPIIGFGNYPPSSNHMYFFLSRFFVGDYYWALSSDTGFIGDQDYIFWNSGATISTGVWYHVTYLITTSLNISVYVDGSLLGTSTVQSNAISVTTGFPIYVFASDTAGSRQLKGYVDELTWSKTTTLSAGNPINFYSLP